MRNMPPKAFLCLLFIVGESFQPFATFRRQRPLARPCLLAQEDDESLEWSRQRDSALEDELGNVHIPSTGISVADEMVDAAQDRFVTDLVPVEGWPGVAQLLSSPINSGSFEPARYLVQFRPIGTNYCLVDIPPYSPALIERMHNFMGEHGRLSVMVVTSRDAIHYDTAAALYATRRSDLVQWRQAFASAQVVTYRLDTPRDCRPSVTQCLDGYGPFAWNGTAFVETGRPLTVEAWDYSVAQQVLSGQTPPDDADNVSAHDEDYSPAAIRQREEGQDILAVFTPGHSFGSVSYVFPHQQVICSGFTLPIEDTRLDENRMDDATGPALDCRGYLSTNKAGVARQVESARLLIDRYLDRFRVVLPSRGDMLILDEDLEERRSLLREIVNQYETIGRIYEDLGITGDSLAL